MNVKLACLGLAFMMCLSGCLYEIRDDIDEFAITTQNRILASRAWRRNCEVHSECAYRHDLKAGFLAGYAAIINGSRGCPPTIPPRKYWDAVADPLVMQARTECWFQGWSYGTIAAESDGVAGLHRIVTRGGGQQLELLPVAAMPEEAFESPAGDGDDPEVPSAPPEVSEPPQPADVTGKSNVTTERGLSEFNSPNAVRGDADAPPLTIEKCAHESHTGRETSEIHLDHKHRQSLKAGVASTHTAVNNGSDCRRPTPLQRRLRDARSGSTLVKAKPACQYQDLSSEAIPAESAALDGLLPPATPGCRPQLESLLVDDESTWTSESPMRAVDEQEIPSTPLEDAGHSRLADEPGRAKVTNE